MIKEIVQRLDGEIAAIAGCDPSQVTPEMEEAAEALLAAAGIRELLGLAEVAAQCMVDLQSNLAGAHDDYMGGKIAHGAYDYVLRRHAAMAVALKRAGFTECHPMLGHPMRPAEAGRIAGAAKGGQDG